MIKNRIYLYLPIVVLVLLFILGTFLDLNIAQGLGAHDDFFTVSTAIILPLLACSALSFIAGFLFADSFKHFKLSWKKIILMGLAILAFIFAIYVSQNEVINKDALNIENGYYVSIPIALAFNGIASVFGYREGLKNENKSIYLLILFVFVIVIITIGLCYFLKKFAIHRIRFIALIEGQYGLNISDYTPWYQSSELYDSFAGDKWNFESFPSGHSAVVMTLGITLPFVSNCYEWGRKHKLVPYLSAIILSYLMAFSRMYSGSHYLSDVTIPGIIMFIPYVVGYEVYFKNFRIDPVESKDF